MISEFQTSGYKLLPSYEDHSEHSIFYTLFTPKDKEIKASILMLHGMQEHSGRYDAFAKYLSDCGFAVLTYDHLGHGKTAKSEKDQGFFQLKKPKEQLVQDAKQLAEFLQAEHPNAPLFVIGHSMGSFILRCLLQESSNLFSGAVIIGTGGKVPGIEIAQVLFGLLNRISPRKRTKLINLAFAKMNNIRFGNLDGNYTEWLSKNEVNQKAFMEDELCGIPFSMNGFHTLVSLNVQAAKRDWSNTIRKDLPLLFISGEEDPIGQFGKGVSKTVDNLRKNGFKHVEKKLYPKMRHEILQEDCKDKVYRDIEDWLQEQLESKK